MNYNNGAAGAAAAQPPGQLLDLLHSTDNFRTQFKLIFENIQSIGRITTEYLTRCDAEDDAFNASSMDLTPTTFVSEPRELNMLQGIFDEWKTIFVTNTELMRELRHYKLKDGRVLKDVLGMHIYTELTRLYLLLFRPALLIEMDNLATIPENELSKETYTSFVSLESSTKHPMWISVVSSFDPYAEAAAAAAAAAATKKKVAKGTKKVEEPDPIDEDVVLAAARIRGIWKKNVMEYTQVEVRLMIMFLTQQINEVPTEDQSVVREYRLIFNTLWLRVAQLMCRLHPASVLDDENMRSDQTRVTGEGTPDRFTINREFCTFCSFYMGELVRRFYYYDAIIKNKLHVETRIRTYVTASAREWVTKAVMGFATSAFETLYKSVIEEGYNYPGDDCWFKFKWDKKVHSRAACIMEFRPHLHARFFSEDQLNRQSIINAAAAPGNQTARLFILKAIDETIKQICPSIPAWQNAFVVPNNGIELATYKLMAGQVPVIIQILSSFWVYEKSKVHVCDNLYEAFGVWAWIIHSRYDDRVYESKVAELMRDIFKGRMGGQPAAAAAQQARGGGFVFD